MGKGFEIRFKRIILALLIMPKKSKEYWKSNGELIRKYRNVEQHILS